MLALQRLKSLLLGMSVNVCANDEADYVEEWHPGLFRKEFLRKCQGQWRCDPANLHHGHESRLDGGTDLVKRSCAGDNGHRGKEDCILDGRDDQVAGEDLQDLSFQAGTAREKPLQHSDEEMA